MRNKNNLSIMANAIRALSMDAVEKANSGHPGMPMGMAEIALTLWVKHLKHNPKDPYWLDRDRFVISNGHGSMLLYSLLHLTGYDLSIEDIKKFRQLNSKTPGHPEIDISPGVETTTGPLGQGLSNAIGMAIAEFLLSTEFNKDDIKLIDHFTYVFLGDGCLMEGISHEACSLAGNLQLSKLIAFYDDNGISIDGKVEGWFKDDTPKRFESYGWHVIPNIDGHDVEEIDKAINKAKNSDLPTLICCKTIIGRGSPNMQGSNKIHGSPLGSAEVSHSRIALDWPYSPFEIPEEVYKFWNASDYGENLQSQWKKKLNLYSQKYPLEFRELNRRLEKQLPENFDKDFNFFFEKLIKSNESIATRKASKKIIQFFSKNLPEFLGGSSDLTASNLTNWDDYVPLRSKKSGNYIDYGVREFAMSAIVNGISLYGGFIPFGATFLTFSDYSRNAIRMAALMKLQSIFVFTHDSIGLGEDGPTHQPVEQISSLRLIPNLDNWRPCDLIETAIAWKQALSRNDGPTSLIFSRQKLDFIERTDNQLSNIKKGGYILRDSLNPKVLLIATGSEVGIALESYNKLLSDGIESRLISLPCTDVFDRQLSSYKKSVLIEGLPRIAIEAGVKDFWYKYVGLDGTIIGIDRFGESAPCNELFSYFGFTSEKIVSVVKSKLF